MFIEEQRKKGKTRSRRINKYNAVKRTERRERFVRLILSRIIGPAR